jgi:hypothetical protein
LTTRRADGREAAEASGDTEPTCPKAIDETEGLTNQQHKAQSAQNPQFQSRPSSSWQMEREVCSGATRLGHHRHTSRGGGVGRGRAKAGATPVVAAEAGGSGVTLMAAGQIAK